MTNRPALKYWSSRPPGLKRVGRPVDVLRETRNLDSGRQDFDEFLRVVERA